MTKKVIKNQHAENPFENPDNKKWGENIWGQKFSMIGLVVILVTIGIVFWADRKGLIDWTEQSNPLEIENPYIQKDTIETQ